MRVVHYIGSLRFGGIERLVYDLVSQQIKRDSIKTAIGIGKLKGEFKTQFESLGATLINFDLSSGFDLNPLKILKVSKVFKLFWNISHQTLIVHYLQRQKADPLAS